MGLGSKYNSSTGCSDCSSTSDGCITTPDPCCESHETKCVAGICLKTSSDVTAATGSFFITFSNLCDTLPIASSLYLYHPNTGLMSIGAYDSETGQYTVSLVDESFEGGVIQTDECVALAYVRDEDLTISDRCLSGSFTVPAVGANETIYMINASGIPAGATLSFNYNGTVGTYTVVSFISVTNGVYAYEVQNTGSGHTPGTVITADADSCEIQVELTSEVDVCDLETIAALDSLTGCANGAPYSLVSTSEIDFVKGDGSGGWEVGKLNNIDCCIVLTDCLKFSGDPCPTGDDSVIVEETNIECFEEAWQEVLDSNPTGRGQTNMPMNIDGYDVVVTAYDSGTRTVTFAPADPTTLPAQLSWDAGQQICLGPCCKSCLNGAQFTNHVTGDGESAPNFALQTTTDLDYTDGTSRYYLIGYDNTDPLTVTVLEIDNTYDDNPEEGPGKPVMSDPLVIRSKICHADDSGCDLMVLPEWNYAIYFGNVPDGVRIHWELGHFAQGSDTLADGVTPNPYASVSTQSAAAGTIVGPSADLSAMLGNTAVGPGGIGATKIFPYAAGYFKDQIYLEKCNCALSIVWHLVIVEAAAGTGNGTITSSLGIRRMFQFHKANERALPLNNPEEETFRA